MHSALAEIRVALLPDGRVRVSSTCLGRPDSSYAPQPQECAPAEVQKLLIELRQRLPGRPDVLPVAHAAAGAPQPEAEGRGAAQ